MQCDLKPQFHLCEEMWAEASWVVSAAQHCPLHRVVPQSKGQGTFSDLEGHGCNLPLSHRWPKKFTTPLSQHPGPTGPLTLAGLLDPINFSSDALCQ